MTSTAASVLAVTRKAPEPSSLSHESIEDPYNLKDLDDHEIEIEWLNKILSHQDNQTAAPDQLSLTNLEIKLSKVNSVLELAISDTSTLVDKSIDEMARGIPRLSLDLQLMKENSLLLRSSLTKVHTKFQLLTESQSESKNQTSPINATPDDTVTSSNDIDQLLSYLQSLDMIKERMESTRTVLRQAEAWSTLESEVTGYLTDPVPSHLKAAERLAEAAKSMAVFQHTHEYEGRRGLMRSLQNELEASLSTNLVKALSDKDVKRCKEFYEIFKMIERESEFKNYYFGSRRSVISSLWNQTVLSSPRFMTWSNDQSLLNTQVKLSSNTLPVFLAKQFYPELIKLLQVEINFLPSIFTNPVETLAEFLKSVLDNLKPSITTRLVENVDCANILASLPTLISCWNLTEELGWKIESLISQLDSELKQTTDAVKLPKPTSPTFQVESNPYKLDRSISLKRPISRSIGSRALAEFSRHKDLSTSNSQGISMIKDWESSLYEPFIDFQSNYQEQEASYLRAGLENITLRLSIQETRDSSKTGQQLTINVIQKLPDVLESMFSLSENALDRCEAFTHGYGILGYVNAVDLIFSECLDIHRKALVTERESREKREKSNSRYDLSGGGTGTNKVRNNQSHLDEPENQMLDLEGLDYSSEDWEVFQLGLQLLATCKTVHDKLCGYEIKIKTRLIKIFNSIRDNNLDETIALNDDLEIVKIKLSKGAKLILEQSILNSCELWEFFNSLQLSSERYKHSSAYHGHHKESNNPITSINPGQNMRRQTIHNSQGSKISSSMTHTCSLYPKTNLSVSNLIKESQRIVQSIILLPLLKQVNEYPHLAIWTQTENEVQRINRINSISTIDLKILNQFSKSPTESISKLGEGLFNLPRLFEIYTTVDEDALSFSLETLPFINYFQVLSNWQEFHHESTLAHSSNDHQPSENHNNNKHPALSSEMVISTWLSSLTLAVVNQFSQNITIFFQLNSSDSNNLNNQNQIFLSTSQQQKNRLSSSGKNQLAIDLEYLNNVVKALDVETDTLDKLKSQIIE